MAITMAEVPFNVLCIEPDSGFRCLLSLLILDELITRVSNHMAKTYRLPVRHIFDLVGGEGSGAIVALLIGRLGLNRASARGLLQEMMPGFCPWGGSKRKAGAHRSHPFVTNYCQPRFCKLDEKGEKVFYSKDSVKTCVLASLEGMPKDKGFSRRIKLWVEAVKTAVRVLPIKIFARLTLGKLYTNTAFKSESISDPTISSPTPQALKERFRSYDPTIARSNVYISDIAQATFTHDNLVAPKTINGRSYADKKKSTNVIFDILDEANACFSDRQPGVFVRIGGPFLENLSTPSLSRTGLTSTSDCDEKVTPDFGFLERMPKSDKLFQIQLPDVGYSAELMDDPDQVYQVFEKWIKTKKAADMMEKCAIALCQSVDARAKYYPEDVTEDPSA